MKATSKIEWSANFKNLEIITSIFNVQPIILRLYLFLSNLMRVAHSGFLWNLVGDNRHYVFK